MGRPWNAGLVMDGQNRPASRNHRGAVALDLPSVREETHRLRTWTNRVAEKVVFPGQRFVVIVCDGQALNLRLVPMENYVSARVIPVEREDGSSHITVRRNGIETVGTYAWRTDQSQATGPLRDALGGQVTLCQVVLDG